MAIGIIKKIDIEKAELDTNLQNQITENEVSRKKGRSSTVKESKGGCSKCTIF